MDSDKTTKNTGLPEMSELEIENRYNDPAGMTLKKLRLGLWFVERKEKFKKALFIFLIVVCSLSWTYVLWGTFSYFLFGMKKDDQMIAEMIKPRLPSHNAMMNMGAIDLQIGSTYLLETGTDKNDFAAILNNPNQKYRGSLEYSLVFQSGQVKKEKGFIMPGEKKYIMFLGVDKSLGQAVIELNNVNWQRVNVHKIPDWEEYKRTHLSFEINNAVFSGGRIDLNRGSKMNDLNFDITNKNPYNYWEVGLLIGLYRNNELVGVNRYNLREAMSGQTYQVKMSWPGILDRADSIDIQPEMDIFSDDIYMKF